MSIILIIELMLGLACILTYVFLVSPKIKSFFVNTMFMVGILVLTILLQVLHGISLKEIGWRIDTFWPAVKIIWPVVAIGTLATIIIGLLRKTIIINYHFFIIAFCYPFWALTQQYLILGLFFLRFKIIFGVNIITILICATIFALLHYPDKLSMLITFIAAIIWLFTFIKAPNAFVLAIAHGWLAAALYYFIFGEDCFYGLKQIKG